MSEYFERYSTRKTLFHTPPESNLHLVITIPSLSEPNLTDCLNSIESCIRPSFPVEVLVLLNEPESTSSEISNQNRQSLKTAQQWARQRNDSALRIYFHSEVLPDKHAGVGLARKILMDEAARRLESVNNLNGIIVGLDADCTVMNNYLVEIENYFKTNPGIMGASIYYEHPLEGPLPSTYYEAIAEYELHLRFYVHAQRYAGARYAYQTVGSAMAVRSSAYKAYGGMNRRKAGEDFYFLQKIMPAGFGELSSTCIFPSPRISSRVPFGTGKAMEQRLTVNKELLTYSPDSFKALRIFYDHYASPSFYSNSARNAPAIPKSLVEFLQSIHYENEINRILKHSTTFINYLNHFHRWFDGFHIMKALHFLRDKDPSHSYTSIPVHEAALWLLNENKTKIKGSSVTNLLAIYRNIDRGIT